VTTKYLVEDDVNPTGLPQVFEESVNGVVLRTYTYGLQRISENQVINNAWTTSFYGYDGFGSVRQLTNLSGTITDTYNYDAFGNLLSSPGPTPNNYLYRGEQYDPDLASTTSAPDTTIPAPDASCPAIQKTAISIFPRRYTSICTPQETQSTGSIHADVRICLRPVRQWMPVPYHSKNGF